MKKSIVRVGYAPITDGETGDTYAAIKWLESDKAGGREYSSDPEGESTEIYADGKVVLSCDSNNGYTHKLTLLDLIDDVAKDWLGRTVNTGGVSEYGNVSEYPRFALLIAEEKTAGGVVVSTYYNSQVSKRPSKAGKTSEGKLEGQYAEFEIKSRPRASDTLICWETTVTDVSKLPTAVGEPTTTQTAG